MKLTKDGAPLTAEQRALWTQYRRLAYKLALRCWRRSSLAQRAGTFEDCLQEAYHALVFAAAHYRPVIERDGRQVPVKFVTYSYHCVFRWLQRWTKETGIVKVGEAAWGNRLGSRVNARAMLLVWPVEGPDGLRGEQDDAGDRHREALANIPARDLRRDQDVTEALDRLPPPYRKVLRLRFGFDGPALCFREIGDMLGCNRSRACAVVQKALCEFRKVYGQAV